MLQRQAALAAPGGSAQSGRWTHTLDAGVLALRGALGLCHADQALLDDAALIGLYLPQRLALRHLLDRCA